MKNKVLLTLLAIFPLCGCSAGTYTYDKADQYIEYQEPVTINNNDLDSLIINWVSGNVTVIQNDKPLSFQEKSNGKKYLPLYYCEFSTGVEIQFAKSGTKNSAYSNMPKDLEVVVPTNYKTIYLNTVSADSVLNLQNLNEINVETVSGECTVNVNQVKTASFDTVSGNINLSISDTSILGSVWVDSVSGNANLYVDPSRGYQLHFDTVSGTAKKNFEKSDTNPYNLYFTSVNGDLLIDEIQIIIEA